MEHISWWRDWAFPFCSWVQSVSKLECGWRYSFHGTKYLRVVLRKTILNSKLITLNFGWSKRKYGGTISQHFRKAQRCWHYWAPLRHQIQKKKSAKKSFVRNRHVFSIHKSANSPTENTSQCRFRNHVTSRPAKAHHTVQKSSPTYQFHFRQQLHRCFWQVSEWIWCWNTTNISFNDF